MRQRLSPLAVYITCALLVLLPLFRPGFVLTLDMVFTPKLHMPATVSSSYLFYAALHVLNFVLPSDVIEKVMLFLILLASGLGMHRLIRHLSPGRTDSYQALSAYFAGIFYMFNPFTYDRFMAGQYGVLAGYALLPWFSRALLVFLQEPALRDAIIVTAWATVISIVSIHTLGMAALLAATAGVLRLWQQRTHKNVLRRLSLYGLLSLAIFFAASSYWLAPLILGKGSTSTTIAGFSSSDQSAFATVGNGWIGRLGNVVRLQGFWLEPQDMYELPQARTPLWGLLALLIWGLVGIGAVRRWREQQRSYVLLFGASALIATALAIGTWNAWLAGHVPFFAGYREPEKFVALLTLAYGVFAARGANRVLQFCHEQAGRLIAIFASVILLAIPFVWTPTMLWGFGGQLTAVQYPSDWFALNRQLDADRSNFRVLFLPWHLYMYFGFAGRIIGNPGPDFFDKPVIISDNPEFRGAASADPTPAKRELDALLPNARERSQLGAQLAPLGIKYVLLAHDDDYQTYAYLHQQKDLHLIAKDATMELYRNEAFRGK